MRMSVYGRQSVLEALRAAGVDLEGVLAVMRGSHVMALNEVLEEDAELVPLTLRDDEGRRIYERSLRFVMLLALRQLYPGQQVRIEFSVGQGVFVRMPHCAMDQAAVDELRRRMQVITAGAHPFVAEEWPVSRALEYFERDGQPDKVALLRRRQLSTIRMYECLGMYEYFYGAMVPSTEYVRVFDLTLYRDGFVMRLPMAEAPDTPAPYMDRPKHLAIFRQSAEWCSILGVENVADLAQLVDDRRMRYFIRVNEALHDQAIGDIAREIVQKNRRIVLIAGPSSSGKTTFAGRLGIHLRVLGRTAYRLSLDDYYLNRDLIPREPDGSIDLESLHTLDLPLLTDHMRRMLLGETVEVPRFSFKTGCREEKGVPLTLGDKDIVIIEGIHGLNPQLCEGLPMEQIHRIFVSALTCINLDDHNRIRTTDVRLLRRIVRDHQFRGTPPEQTLSMWPSVRRGEETWIFPYQEQADSMFNTALHYELPVLRHYAYPLLKALSPDLPEHVLAARLIKSLNYIQDIPESALSEIPPLSLLREFIGGCTIDEE